MVAAVRQTITVPPNGTIQIRADELRPGMRAEVIVLVESEQPASSPLTILDSLQDHLHLSQSAANDWINRASAERRAFGTRG